jgi:dynein heavy chain
MYGGRVTDSFDRRVLTTYLEEYMGDFLFDDYQAFYFAREGYDYMIPPAGPLENYSGGLMKIPLNNSPMVFGLHSNADIRYNFEVPARTSFVFIVPLDRPTRPTLALSSHSTVPL